MNKIIDNLKIKIFADGANKKDMLELYERSYIKGLTTNPTLMSKAKIENYEEFALSILREIKEKPISFEVFADDFNEMERQARIINDWQSNVYVKVPITNTKKESCAQLVKKLTSDGIKVNVTAIMTLDQVKEISDVLNPKIPSYVSIFAGRIADTGKDPLKTVSSAIELLRSNLTSEIIWASPRELLNLFQANDIGCHAITITTDLINKFKLLDYDLEEYSLDTVKMFYNDALDSGFKI
jgi:transaldolase|tara:strand:+ start:103 stop:822 length:720 start_codon:yes stop_codon:yes gene_type:complete